jgi:hypothetical protein
MSAMAALQARQWTVRKTVSFMQGRSGICIWRGVGTSDIRHRNCKPDNDKVGAPPGRPSGKRRPGWDRRHGQRRTSVVVRAAHVVVAAPAHQLAAAALQTRRAVRTPLAGMLGGAMRLLRRALLLIPLVRILLLDRRGFSGECRRHDGQPTPSPAGDSSGIRAHLIQCAVRQNHA